MKLEITTPSAQAIDSQLQHIIRAPFDNTVIGFRFKYKNSRSEGMAFSATGAQIQENWNSLMNEYGFTCTAVSGGFDQSSVINFTIKTKTG